MTAAKLPEEVQDLYRKANNFYKKGKSFHYPFGDPHVGPYQLGQNSWWLKKHYENTKIIINFLKKQKKIKEIIYHQNPSSKNFKLCKKYY